MKFVIAILFLWAILGIPMYLVLILVDEYELCGIDTTTKIEHCGWPMRKAFQ